jgi:hypothetical protein
MADIRDELEQLLRDHQFDREHGEPCMPYKAAWLALRALPGHTVQGPVCDHVPAKTCPVCIADDEVVIAAMTGVRIPPGALPARVVDTTPR